MPNRPKTIHSMIFRCDIWREAAASTDAETGAYDIPGTHAAHLTDVFCAYSYDVRRTTGEREGETRQSSVRYLEVFVPIDTDVQAGTDIIAQIRDRAGNGVIYNDIDIVAVQPEHYRNWKRLVCQERK